MSDQHPLRRKGYRAAVVVGVVAALGAGVFVMSRLERGRVDGSARVVTWPGHRAPEPIGTASRSAPSGTPATAMRPAPAPKAVPGRRPATGTGTGTGSLSPRAFAPGQGATSVARTVRNLGSMPRDHHTLRIVSARADLSGQHELAWAADAGHRVGNARCTQNFQFNPRSRAGIRPTMLLCWRTSRNRTVYTVAVDIIHRPSERASVAIINRVWSRLR